jgi:hypothetical protein
MSLKDILDVLKNEMEGFPQIVRVRRQHIWEDALRVFSKKDFKTCCNISVHFIGEEAADEGGPRREFLRLLVDSIRETSGILEGSQGEKKSFSLNPLLMSTKAYFYAGQMVGTSLQQGGPGLRCLVSALYFYIAGKLEDMKITKDDITDPFTVERIAKVIHVYNTKMIKTWNTLCLNQ